MLPSLSYSHHKYVCNEQRRIEYRPGRLLRVWLLGRQLTDLSITVRERYAHVRVFGSQQRLEMLTQLHAVLDEAIALCHCCFAAALEPALQVFGAANLRAEPLVGVNKRVADAGFGAAWGYQL
jgi:hypothetical protein